MAANSHFGVTGTLPPIFTVPESGSLCVPLSGCQTIPSSEANCWPHGGSTTVEPTPLPVSHSLRERVGGGSGPVLPLAAVEGAQLSSLGHSRSQQKEMPHPAQVSGAQVWQRSYLQKWAAVREQQGTVQDPDMTTAERHGMPSPSGQGQGTVPELGEAQPAYSLPA